MVIPPLTWINATSRRSGERAARAGAIMRADDMDIPQQVARLE